MNTLIVILAQYLLFALAAVAALVWLTRTRTDKVRLAAQAVVGLALVGIGIWLGGHLHSDPRPFVHDPHSKPLFAHPADNGFPSDHSAAAGLLAALLLRWKWLVGLIVGAGAAAIAWARVAAHVHHAQDVIAGLAIGLAAGAIAIAAVTVLFDRVNAGGTTTGRFGMPRGGQAR